MRNNRCACTTKCNCPRYALHLPVAPDIMRANWPIKTQRSRPPCRSPGPQHPARWQPTKSWCGRNGEVKFGQTMSLWANFIDCNPQLSVESQSSWTWHEILTCCLLEFWSLKRWSLKRSLSIQFSKEGFDCTRWNMLEVHALVHISTANNDRTMLSLLKHAAHNWWISLEHQEMPTSKRFVLYAIILLKCYTSETCLQITPPPPRCEEIVVFLAMWSSQSSSLHGCQWLRTIFEAHKIAFQKKVVRQISL